MNLKRDVLMANINFYISAGLLLSVGLFFLTIGFKLTHMENPITSVLDPETAALLSE